MRLRISSLALALVTASAFGGCGAATQTATPNTTAPAASWRAPASIPGLKTAFAISCPAAGFCVAAGNTQVAEYHGGSWTKPVKLDFHRGRFSGLSAVTCASESFCLAGDGVGGLYTFNGSRWTGPVRVDMAGIADLSCPTSSFCAAADQSGDVLLWNGRAWSKPATLPGGPQVFHLACVAGPFCMAVDGAGSDALALRHGSWHLTGSLNVSTPSGGSEPDTLSAVSCASATVCAALDDFGDAFTWTHGKWSGSFRFDPNLTLGPDAVSCPTASFCVLVDADGLASTWNGTAWAPPHHVGLPHEILIGVSCATTSFCVAIDDHGRALFYR
jgi:hypothetical protein